jgi:hypothetical protein
LSIAFAFIALQTPFEQFTFFVADVAIVSAASAEVAAIGKARPARRIERKWPDRLNFGQLAAMCCLPNNSTDYPITVAIVPRLFASNKNPAKLARGGVRDFSDIAKFSRPS